MHYIEVFCLLSIVGCKRPMTAALSPNGSALRSISTNPYPNWQMYLAGGRYVLALQLPCSAHVTDLSQVF